MKVPTILASLLCATVAFMQTASASPGANRSLFVWNSTEIRNDPATQNQFFHFLGAPFGSKERGIKTLFFDGVHKADFSDPGATGSVRRFLRTAHMRGMRVFFLCGDKSWATVEHRSDALDYLNTMLNFNLAGEADERYDGIAYDVEPYLNVGWPSPDLQSSYVAFLDKAFAAIHASGQNLTMAAIIPFWFSNPELHGLDRAVIDRSDMIVIMDYVRTASRLVDAAGKELVDAARAHKPAWVAVETGSLPDTPNATFFDLTNTQMECVLAESMPGLKRTGSFAGYAIHSLRSYQPMKP